MKHTIRWLLGSLGIAAAAGSAWVYRQYRREVGPLRTQAHAGSRIIDTPCGAIEYATAGQGEPLLVIHGAGGGYDQGLLIGREQIGAGYRVIAPSRFGYLGAPVPADASASAQAEAYVCLLDALGLGQVPVIAASAGVPSAVELALRHPDRVSALVLVSPAGTYPGQPQPARPHAPAYVFHIFLKSDFAFWLATKVAHADLLQLLGVPQSLRARLAAPQLAYVDALMRSILPVSERQAGLANDTRVVSHLAPYPAGQIHTPTLLIGAADDPMQTLGNAEYLAQHLPNAHLVALPAGGHLLVGQEAVYQPVLRDFLARFARPQAATRTAETGA